MTAATTAAGDGSGVRRFVPPPRAAVDPQVFAHPVFAGLRDVHDLLASPEWPSIAALETRLTLPGKHLVEQDAALLADGLHYEARIAQGRIATRADNWHDLFNALVWARYPQLKQVLNVQQCRHIASMPPGQRNRAQAALTQFDETGVIVRVRDEDVLAAWDVHDWPALFEPARWQSGDIAIAAIFGHALMEQALLPGRLLVGKCVVVHGEVDDACVDAVTAAIAEGRAVTDPLQLRPLPLAGIPGWHQGQDAAFYADAAYFRPLRAGRQYPPPLHGAM
ncbi:DUF3025 domain-containing protein [Stenotrophomonas maltophilia]|uniref:DUF3025 domain-containing protein n=1 Tax=Stenotrophomonas maltophilia TaxID=40324 RepID=UPI000B4D589C|nr:DUF3025 domain-containing protein [Stenotrophomonas maltophilia]EKT4065993.1 DUF3025 domain-containing protein [Stenotrophomonas maltophilia]EKU9979189.1 DUF3025 domain-containing protein [Stenotrophomonas maltophilia]EKV1264909.1 DUF3025 domain-containing protein [Stenotrophomonas maltophilia]EKX6271059.1 DUF3025 domain-containing protein [Stenotrophomonas maltophilia]MBH1579656.1 DUF3025 domain-containing protein [Stenotrophomonas maltophilia]